MKALLIACAAVAWAAVAGGCSSGDGGPASPPFNPFGTDSVQTTGVEPTVSGADQPPGSGGGGGSSIAELCATDCARIEAACPSGAGTNCVSSCSSAAPPGCQAEFQAYLACISTATIDCTGGSVSITTCQGQAMLVSNCLSQQGTTASL